ncbi:MAG: sigma factor-like helix-turn-helix DNA-binding protein [Gemella sp.]|nr:sigma factor-like helix-turn-helix DNA-binding protein [Gemella sp.]
MRKIISQNFLQPLSLFRIQILKLRTIYYIHTRRNMERKLYVEYLLKNAFRLEDEFLQDDTKTSLLEHMSNKEKVILVKDVLATIELYNNTDIARREVLILRYIKGLLVKEVAKKLHYSETRVKQICRAAKEELDGKIGGKYAKEN